MARFIRSKDPRVEANAGDPLPFYVAATTEQKQKSKGGGEDTGDAKAEGGTKKVSKKGEELKEEMDSLMDEIDEVLEENAEEFVKNYVQRGGQ